MGGITSGVGVFSGINSASIIDQLLALEARPKQQAQSRILQLQLQQGAWLDINTRMTALRSSAKGFQTNNTFQAKSATVSNTDVLTATASIDAPPGTYQFVVDRLVSSQQMLGRGFASRDTTAAGLTKLTIESDRARLDRDVSLAQLNDGAGIERGRISITDSAGRVANVDLTRVGTVNEVLEAINSNGTAQVTATIEGGRFVVKDNAGGSLTIANAGGYNTAASLGLAGTATGQISGTELYRLSNNTSLAALNDGNGVSINNPVGEDVFSFSLTIDDGGSEPMLVKVNVGDVWEDVDGTLTKTGGAVANVGQALDRINSALTEAGFSTIAASIDSANGRIVLRDSVGGRTITVAENGDSTARDLGLLVSPTVGGEIEGRRILAGMTETLAGGINGGSGIGGDGQLNFTLRDGSTFNLTLNRSGSLQDVFRQIEAASGTMPGGQPKVSVALDSRGTGFRITDNTGGGGNLIIEGTNGADTAASLGISTGPTGVAANTKDSGNMQRQYIGRATAVSSLNNGKGLGTGVFRITDATGASQTVDIGSDTLTIGDLIDEVNSRGLAIEARINANGDGIEIVETIPDGGTAGVTKIKIEDVSGAVAKGLNILGEATGTGADNKLNGSYEREINVSAADTLQQVMQKINEAKAGVNAAIINDGSGLTPFRLSLSSTQAGVAGRFILATEGGDLGLQTLDKGNDARAFYGSSDPARGILVGGSSNTLDGIVTGVRIDLKGVSNDPVTISVANDTEAIEAAVEVFVRTFNTVIERIDFQSKYDTAAKRGGPLLNDGTARELRAQLFTQVTAPSLNTAGRFDRLVDIGIKVSSGGRIEFDKDRFRQAMAEDPASVQALFTAQETEEDEFIDLDDGIRVRNPNAGRAFTSLGVMGQFEQLAERFLNTTNGVLTGRTDGIQKQIDLQTSRIGQIDDRLARRRAQLERQFQAMESAIGKLQTQQAALASLPR